MRNAVANTNTDSGLEALVIKGDLSQLSPDQRVDYLRNLCQTLGLNFLTRPFELGTFDGKLQLYARKDCADQLRKIHGVSITELQCERIEDLYVARASARDKSGKVDHATGIVSVKGLAGLALANAMMKAETKAKRRVTLSICGLGVLDETEVEDVGSNESATVPTSLVAGDAEEWRARLDTLIVNFRRAGVSEGQILEKFARQTRQEFTRDQYEELRKIGPLYYDNRKAFYEHFKTEGAK